MAIPSNPEYSVPQLRFMIREVEGVIGRGISAAEWDERRAGRRDDPSRP